MKHFTLLLFSLSFTLVSAMDAPSFEMQTTSSMMSTMGTSSLANQGFVSSDEYMRNNSLGSLVTEDDLSSPASGPRRVPDNPWAEPGDEEDLPIGNIWLLAVLAVVYAVVVFFLHRYRSKSNQPKRD